MKCLLRTFATFHAASLCVLLCLSVTFVAPCHAAPSVRSAPPEETVTIPGPLRSFMRMAAISQKVPNDEVLPLLSRNVFMQGYQRGTPTEYLRLLDRYVQQARELQILAGPSETIHVTNCDDAGTLVQILGYRMRDECGQKNFFLETANPERAFLTIDSGFPLTDLEEALQKGIPFTYAYPVSRVPVLFRESDWLTLSAGQKKATPTSSISSSTTPSSPASTGLSPRSTPKLGPSSSALPDSEGFSPTPQRSTSTAARSPFATDTSSSPGARGPRFPGEILPVPAPTIPVSSSLISSQKTTGGSPFTSTSSPASTSPSASISSKTAA